MADLTLKAVEDIRVGDKLMGIDGKPRTVLHLYSGQDKLFKVKQARGIDYVVSSNHILSLRENWKEHRKTVTTGTEMWMYHGKIRERPVSNRIYTASSHSYELTNIPLPEYLNKSAKWKRQHKGWKLAGVELKEHKVLIDPYFVGLWLGDGTCGAPSITTSDQPVIEYLKWFALRSNLKYYKVKGDPYGHTLSKMPGGRTNPLIRALDSYGILHDKRIPHAYLNNSRRIRLALLAGLAFNSNLRRAYSLCGGFNLFSGRL